MACTKCRKKRARQGRVVTLPDSSTIGDGLVEVDDETYYVQSRMYTTIAGVSPTLRFLSGERVHIAGTLLCAILSVSPDLFIFLDRSAKDKFLSRHISFQGILR